MIKTIKFIIDIILKIPRLVLVLMYDFLDWLVFRRWLEFKDFGFDVYCGMFGEGKSISMVNRAYRICKRFKCVTLLTNLPIYDFPKHTKIIPLVHIDQMINATRYTLILLDETSTIFDARDWKNKGMTAELRTWFRQLRKNKILILSTAQRYHHVDKQMRDLTRYVIDCKCYFNRLVTNRSFDGMDYEMTMEDIEKIPPLIKATVYIQSKKLRIKYDTDNLVTDDLRSAKNETLVRFADRQQIIRDLHDVITNEYRLYKKNTLREMFGIFNIRYRSIISFIKNYSSVLFEKVKTGALIPVRKFRKKKKSVVEAEADLIVNKSIKMKSIDEILAIEDEALWGGDCNECK